MTVTFAPCPSYKGYEASSCGLIRRAARPSKAADGAAKGTTIPAKLLKPIAARPSYVGLPQPHGWVRIADMVADPWPQYDADELDSMGRPTVYRPIRFG